MEDEIKRKLLLRPCDLNSSLDFSYILILVYHSGRDSFVKNVDDFLICIESRL